MAEKNPKWKYLLHFLKKNDNNYHETTMIEVLKYLPETHEVLEQYV